MSETRRESLIHLWGRIKARLYTKFLSGCFFGIGEGTRIIPPFRFYNLSQVQLGKNVIIHRYSWIQVSDIVDQTIRPKLTIGDNVVISENVIISAAKKIILEERVALAKNVLVTDHHHSFEDIEKPIIREGPGSIQGIAEVRICREAWVGQNSIVMPGVTIGKHSIIGAQSIVNKNIPDYCVAMGTPAKVVKKYNWQTGQWERV